MDKKNYSVYATIFGIGIIAIILRLYGLNIITPFWSDEFSAASQAKLILEQGISVLKNPYLERNHMTGNMLIAFAFSFFGPDEFTARLPFAFIGALIPVLLFILGRKLFDYRTAISAALLSTFSYFEITWSRQARGYILLQLLVLLGLYFYFKILHSKKSSFSTYVLFSLTLIMGILTHIMFYIFIIALIVHFVFFYREKFISFLKKPLFYALSISAIGISVIFGIIGRVISIFDTQLFGVNNMWYYHSFLWREYGLITFLSIIGIIFALIKKPKDISAILIFILLQLGVLAFVFKPYVSRYLLPIFPLFLLFAGFALSRISEMVTQDIPKSCRMTSIIVTLALTFFIIGNGDKFVAKPKKFYSVNHDFREAALLDYNQIYGIITSKGGLQNNNTAVIDTSLDRLSWYIENKHRNMYLMRWIDDAGYVNGIPKSTPYSFNSEKERVIANTDQKLIGNLNDLEKTMKKYPKGFIFIDDATMPKDVIDYAEKNLKKEMYLDHYTLDDNPYSIWPATLYSWGVE